MTYPAPVVTTGDNEAEVLYSFMISNMPIRDGIRLFARAYDLNIATDEDVTGILDIEFRDVSLERALSLMLDNLDYYWEINDGVIRVRSQQTRQFSVDYLRLVRTGTGVSSATVSSKPWRRSCAPSPRPGRSTRASSRTTWWGPWSR